MADMKLFIELLARSTGLKRELSESENGFRRFGSAAKREMDSIRQASGRLGGQLAALGITVGALQQFRMSAQLDKDLTQIGQTAGVGSGKVTALRQDLFRMGKESGQDIESLKNGFNSLVQSGLSMREATSTLDGVNVAMAVTGAKAETLSAGLTVAAQAFQFDLAKPGQALELLDKMTVAGRLGNAELESLSQIFARVGVNAQAAGLDFNKTLGFVEALSKVERNPERLATLADSTLRVFTNMNYMASAQKGTGIRFYSQKGDRRDPLAVLQDVKKKYDTLKTDFQRDSFIQAAFGKADLDTIKGIRTLLQSGSLNEVAKMTGLIKDAGGSLKRDFSEATRNLIDQAGRLKNTMRDAADGFVAPINKALANFVKHMLDKKSDGGMGLTGGQIAGGTVALAGGAYVMSKIGKSALGQVAGRILGKGSSLGVGVAEGIALKAATGVAPVFVTNAADIGGGGADIVAGAGAGAATAVAIASIPAVATAVMGYLSIKTGEHLAENEAKWRSISDLNKLRTQHMVMGGGPNSFQVKTIDNELKRFDKDPGIWQRTLDAQGVKPPIQNNIQVKIDFDALGRVFIKTNDMNTNTKTGGNRGDFFSALMLTEAM